MNDLAREMERVLEKIQEIHRNLQAELVGFAIEDLVARSPVRTGAYRAAHFVGVGADQPERLVYDSPEHPIPEVDYKPGAQAIFQVPDGELARAAYEQEEPFQRAVIANDRFYASALEYGTATSAPRTIYGTAEVSTEQKATELADRRIVIE